MRFALCISPVSCICYAYRIHISPSGRSMQPSVSFIFKTLRDTKMFPRNETKHRCAFLNFLRVILRVDASWMMRSLRLSSRICLTHIVQYDLFNENLIFLRIHLQILSEVIKESQAAGITSNRIDRCGHRRYRKLEKYRKKKEEKIYPACRWQQAT